jgi:hypothetical protein
MCSLPLLILAKCSGCYKWCYISSFLSPSLSFLQNGLFCVSDWIDMPDDMGGKMVVLWTHVLLQGENPRIAAILHHFRINMYIYQLAEKVLACNHCVSVLTIC